MRHKTNTLLSVLTVNQKIMFKRTNIGKPNLMYLSIVKNKATKANIKAAIRLKTNNKSLDISIKTIVKINILGIIKRFLSI